MSRRLGPPGTAPRRAVERSEVTISGESELSLSEPRLLARIAFAATIFLSAFLLFQVELVAGKAILPWFGGAAAVWTTCMLVYQLLLLLGYGWAAAAVRRMSVPRQVALHRSLLVVSVVWLAIRALLSRPLLLAPPPDAVTREPILQIVLALLGGIGLPFFLLAATGPLLQSWLATAWPRFRPYRLYALSNLGSLIGLLSYPTVVEPALDLTAQARLWSGGYAAFALGSIWCSAILLRRRLTSAARQGEGKLGGEGAPASRSHRLLWFTLSACGSLLLLASTNMVCEDVASVPLLWVLPLGLYLCTFIIAFESDRWYRRGLVHGLFGAAALLTCLALSPWGALLSPVILVAVFLLVLFSGALACHGELARLKPAVGELTSFYLTIAAGGATGGAFTVLVAPILFPGYWEFHLAVAGTATVILLVLLRDRASWIHARRAWLPLLIAAVIALVPEWEARSRMAALVPHALRWPPWLVLALRAAFLLALYLAVRYRRHGTIPRRWSNAYVIGALLLLCGALAREALARPSHLLARSRSFYGVLTVQEIWPGNRGEDAYELRHGRTTHGLQLVDTALRARATTYFSEDSGIGLALLDHKRLAPGGRVRVGVVGLGVGTLATYARPGDYFRFYEINPDVIRFARGERGYFSFLRDCEGTWDIVPGDARVSLTSEAARGEFQRFDVLAIDAFSGDAIPVHLLTREAFGLYLGHLAADGVLAVHVSSKSLDLAPVLRTLADHWQLQGVMVHAPGGTEGVWPSHWVLLSRTPAALDFAEASAAREPVPGRRDLRLWTDQYTNLLSVLR